MNQDEIIEMARQAGMAYEDDSERYIAVIDDIQDFAKLIAAKARFEAADDAWMELVKHGIGWELRKAVTDRIHERDEK
jgi:hypothetical protein